MSRGVIHILSVDPLFRQHVTESHDYAAELWVTDNGDLIEPLPILGSTSFQVGANLIRRNGTITLPNADGRYTPGAGLIDFDRAFLLRYGVLIPSREIVVTTTLPAIQYNQAGVQYNEPGVFYGAGASSTSTQMTEPEWQWCNQPLLWPDSDEWDVGGSTVTLGVSDGMRIVSSESQLSVPLAVEANTPVEALIRQALVACGASDDNRYFDLDDGGALFSTGAGYEAGTRWADILTQVCTDYALDLWAAPPLVYTLRPIPDAATAPIAARWARGSDVRVLALTKRRQNLAKNHAIVTGLSLDRRPVWSEAFDNNPYSPTRFGAPGIGDLSIRYHSDNLTTEEQCLIVARSLLVRRAVQVEWQVDVPMDPSLDRRDVVMLEDARYSLDAFPLGAGPGSQTITVTAARSLS